MPKFRSYEVLVALRYTRARKFNQRRNRFVSFISFASMAGIALGVAALIVVLSVMNGFQKEVRDRMLSVVSHIEILAPPELAALPAQEAVDWEAVLRQALQNPRVLAGAPYVLSQAMISSGDSVRGALIRGIVPAAEGGVADIGRKMRFGSLDTLTPDSFNIALGVDLARAMRVGVGDRVVLIAPQGNITVAGMVPRLKQFNVTGIFESGHFEYDSALAMVHRDDAERLFRSGSVAGLRLKTTDPLQAHVVAQQLLATLPANLAVRDWGQINRNWFAAVQVEKRMMFIILTLIIAVAAFNLVSSLVMTVTEKQADIAILRTLGASPRSIMAIFMLQGALVGVLGSVLGVAGGTLLAMNVETVYSTLGLELIPKGIYFIDYLPTDTRFADVATIGLTAFVMSILATLYPSWSASRVNPAEALRYE